MWGMRQQTCRTPETPLYQLKTSAGERVRMAVHLAMKGMSFEAEGVEIVDIPDQASNTMENAPGNLCPYAVRRS